MTEKHEQRLLALIAVLAMPDLPDLLGVHHRPRGRTYTQPRDILRDADVIKRDLATAYTSWRRQEHHEGDISCVVSVRRYPRLKIAARTA